MPSIPLPNVDSDRVQSFADSEPNSLSAYRVCLHFERQLDTTDKVRFVRILGYLLLYAPNRAVREEVSKCIHSRKDWSDLTDIGSFFERYFILPFKKYKGRTPASSEHPSRPSFESTKKEMKEGIIQAPKDHADAKRQALIRDNWRCVVTDVVHEGAPADVISAYNPRPVVACTECAHIIPEATFFGVKTEDECNPKLDYSASVLAVLRRFRYDISTFNGEKVHSLTNIITMEKDIHEAFDRLKLYFEDTGRKNYYKVKTFSPYPVYRGQNDEVTFTTTNNEFLPVPSPRLLALHATCCKVAHLSGSAEYIDSVYRDLEEKGVLASDGSSDGLLQFKLLSLANPAITFEEP